MDLIKLLNEMAKTKDQKPKQRNFVAKYMSDTTKGGAHEAKKGQKASRNRQKKNWRKEEGL